MGEENSPQNAALPNGARGRSLSVDPGLCVGRAPRNKHCFSTESVSFI